MCVLPVFWWSLFGLGQARGGRRRRLSAPVQHPDSHSACPRCASAAAGQVTNCAHRPYMMDNHIINHITKTLRAIFRKKILILHATFCTLLVRAWCKFSSIKIWPQMQNWINALYKQNQVKIQLYISGKKKKKLPFKVSDWLSTNKHKLSHKK